MHQIYEPIEFQPAGIGSSLWLVQMCYVHIIKGINQGHISALGAVGLIKGYEWLLTHPENELLCRRFLRAKDKNPAITPVEFMDRYAGACAVSDGHIY